MKTKNNICHVGDIILHRLKRMEVAQVICQGKPGEKTKSGRNKGIKATVSAYPIMEDNGQVLKRNPRYIGEDWEMVKSMPYIKQWAGKYTHCVECHTTTRKHRGRGLCHSCYGRMLRGGLRTRRGRGE